MCSTVEQHRLMSDGKMRNPVKRANLQSAQRPLSISWTPREIGTAESRYVLKGNLFPALRRNSWKSTPIEGVAGNLVI
jgi:hypothetical protein